jgi:hypothetical protein
METIKVVLLNDQTFETEKIRTTGDGWVEFQSRVFGVQHTICVPLTSIAYTSRPLSVSVS